MIEIKNGSIKALMEVSNNGPFMQAEIVSLMGVGKMRIECGKVSTAVFCNPLDKNTFLWQFTKVDDQHIALSPVNSCIGQPIYVSVRDDNDYYLQMQAPHSNDWITAVNRDEIIGFKMHDMNVAQFTGFNGKFITVNTQPDYIPVQRFSGWRTRSMGDGFQKTAQWLINIKTGIQAHINFTGMINTRATLETQLSLSNIDFDEELITKLTEQIL